MRRVVTDGSVWLLDEPAGRYMRMPRTEQPRPNGWGSAAAGPLQDLVWHPMTGWAVELRLGVEHLVIRRYDDAAGMSVPVVYAPNPVIEETP